MSKTNASSQPTVASTRFTPLVVGSEGFIGKYLVAQVKKQGGQLYQTRHKLSGSALRREVAYDLAADKPVFLEAWPKVSHAFICAHAGSIDTCAQKPAETAAVNVAGTQRLLAELKSRRITPIFFSSNMVFPGDKPWYMEDDTVDPLTEYGRQKASVEKYIQEHFSEHLIIRLTKVYSLAQEDGTFLTDWFTRLSANQPIQAFSDIFIAPVWIEDVVVAAIRLAQQRVGGIFHIGGSQEQSFLALAQELAAGFDFPSSLIENEKSTDRAFVEPRAVHNSLAIDKIKRTLEFTPHSPQAVFRRLHS